MSGATIILIFEQLGAGAASKTKRLFASVSIGGRWLPTANTQERYTCAVAVNYGGY